MATESDEHTERDRGVDGSADDPKDTEAERKASTSMEYPSNVTRSTQDLTVGGDKKDPQAADRPG